MQGAALRRSPIIQSVSSDDKTLTAERTDYPPQGAPIKSTRTHARVGAAPPGAHAISGTWHPIKIESPSDRGLIGVYKVDGDTVTSHSDSGEGYSGAKFGGPDVPLQGGPKDATMAVKRIDANTIEELYKENGKLVETTRTTVHGNTADVVVSDPKGKVQQTFTAERIGPPR